MVDAMDEQNLLAFQRRLKEICKSYDYPSRRMLWLIVVMVAITCVNAYLWIIDAREKNIPLSEMYWSKPSFTITLFLTLVLFFLRFHEVANARQIIVNNLREQLKPYALTCTDNGTLILKRTNRGDDQYDEY